MFQSYMCALVALVAVPVVELMVLPFVVVIVYWTPFVDVTRFASVPTGRVGEFERAIVDVLKRFRVGAYDV